MGGLSVQDVLGMCRVFVQGKTQWRRGFVQGMQHKSQNRARARELNAKFVFILIFF